MNEKIIKQAKRYINNLLGPLENHYYHEYGHALEVMERCLYLGKREGLNEEEIEILSLASLFHDSGFIIQYDSNEIIGAGIAKNYLRSILYPEKNIKKIEELILATELQAKPKNLLERIIKDADMDNLGRDDFFDKGMRLKKEIETIKNIKILEPDWNHYSIDLLINHQFLTHTEREEREDKKQENIKKLKKKLEK